jgi:hypothetical protein
MGRLDKALAPRSRAVARWALDSERLTSNRFQPSPTERISVLNQTRHPGPGFHAKMEKVIGLVPLAAGVFDRCVFAPLFGLPFAGPRLRQTLE